MTRTLSLQNRQRVRRVDTRLLRHLTLHVLEQELKIDSFELAIHLVGMKEMARVNWDFLQHEGSTDVITFDHSDVGVRPSSGAEIFEPSLIKKLAKSPVKSAFPRPGRPHSGAPDSLNGELFICVDDAVKQAREFRTTWQSELARYVIHGLLHLCGHDDLSPEPRRKMKREENRLLKLAAKEFSLSKLARAGQSQIANLKS